MSHFAVHLLILYSLSNNFVDVRTMHLLLLNFMLNRLGLPYPPNKCMPFFYNSEGYAFSLDCWRSDKTRSRSCFETRLWFLLLGLDEATFCTPSSDSFLHGSRFPFSYHHCSLWMKMLHACHFQNSIGTKGNQKTTVSENFNMSWHLRFLEPPRLFFFVLRKG
jgi:hypothetical protein